jgi:hypothetical protein
MRDPEVQQCSGAILCCAIVPNGRTIAHPDFVFIVRCNIPNAALARLSE